jgi:hypothetical protein
MQASAKAEIRHVWTAFFSSSTPASKKIRLLKNGQRFAPLIVAESKSPLARQTTVKVTKVQLVGPARATVFYSILVAGKPALTHASGIALRVGRSWKVDDQTFCRLLSLQGPTPPACKRA